MKPIKTQVRIKGMSKIPGFSNYVISDNGSVIANRITGLVSSIDRRDIHTIVQIYDDNNKKRKKQVDELMMTTFGTPMPKDKPFIIHLDYNKHNDNIKNLKWATKEEHDQYVDKLIENDLHKVDVYDDRTGETKIMSLDEASVLLSITRDSLYSRCSNPANEGKWFLRVFRCRFSDPGRPWGPVMESSDKVKLTQQSICDLVSSYKNKVYDKQTGTVALFNTWEEAYTYAGYSPERHMEKYDEARNCIVDCRYFVEINIPKDGDKSFINVASDERCNASDK